MIWGRGKVKKNFLQYFFFFSQKVWEFRKNYSYFIIFKIARSN